MAFLKNRKGMGAILGIMMFMFSFIIAVIISPALRDLIIEARDSDHLSCGEEGATTGQSITCIFVDIILPLFIGTIIFAGLATITNKYSGG